MATEGYFESWQVTAVDDWSTSGALNKFVDHGGTFSAGMTMVAGVLKSRAKAGQLARVAVDGTVKVVTGVAVTTPGNPIVATTSGFAAVGTSTIPFLGRIVAASCPAASGDLITIVMV